MPTRKLIIVAGMHRSGTSAITGTLEGLGVQLGESLATPQEGINDRGYKEDINVINIHENMLWSLPATWDSIFPTELDELGSAIHTANRAAIDDLLANYFKNDTLYAVKDPRICLFLPLWLDSCERLGIEPLVVIPTREPRSVARSLNTRDRMNLQRAQLLWIKYYLSSERYSRQHKRIFISYEQLLSNFDEVVSRLISAIGITVSVDMLKAAAEFVSPALNRSQRRRDKQDYETWITRDSYQLYKTMQESHNSPQGTLSQEFDKVAVNYAKYIEGLDPVIVDQYDHALAHAAEFRGYWRDAINSRAVKVASLLKKLKITK